MGQRELDQGRGTAKCFLIYLINCIERQVEENQVLNLVEKRIRDKSDIVPREVQVFQTALYWVQSFYGDFRKLIESLILRIFLLLVSAIQKSKFRF